MTLGDKNMVNVQKIQRELIKYFYCYSANELKTICEQYGLACDTTLEPMCNKANFIRSGLQHQSLEELQNLMTTIIKENNCPKFTRAIKECLEQDPFEITFPIRRAIISFLSIGHSIEGKESIPQFLNRVWDLKIMPSYYGYDNLEVDIIRHIQANEEMGYEELFEVLDVLYISDIQFKEFLTQLVHPNVRINREDQLKYVQEINELLKQDGYLLMENTNCGEEQILYHIEKTRPCKTLVSLKLLFAPIYKKFNALTENQLLELSTNQDEQVLFYNDFIDSKEGLTWEKLVRWWNKGEQQYSLIQERELYKRLGRSLETEAERLFFNQYYKLLHPKGSQIPALIPQVYCKYSLAGRNINPETSYNYQRMSFQLIMPKNIPIIIEIVGNTAPRISAQKMADQRKLKMSGYEIYSFHEEEFTDKITIARLIEAFIEQLFYKHKIEI